VANPGQDAAVRLALAEASSIEGAQPTDFRVTSVRLEPYQNTAVRYFDVELMMDTGTKRWIHVAADHSWVRLQPVGMPRLRGGDILPRFV
jgi:hypothetical protein